MRRHGSENPTSYRNYRGTRSVTTTRKRKKNEKDVRSHSHDSSFMHSDVSFFYSYTVVAETHFVIVTVPLVSLFMP
jgi:hypothetical protein